MRQDFPRSLQCANDIANAAQLTIMHSLGRNHRWGQQPHQSTWHIYTSGASFCLKIHLCLSFFSVFFCSFYFLAHLLSIFLSSLIRIVRMLYAKASYLLAGLAGVHASSIPFRARQTSGNTIVFEGRISQATVISDFDSTNSPFQPDFTKGEGAFPRPSFSLLFS